MRRLTSWTHLAWAAIALGAVLRLAWVVVLHPPYEHVYSDMELYVERAFRLVDGGELVTSDNLQAPGTQLLLALPFLVLGDDDAGLRAAALVWWALSSVTPLLLWGFARELVGARAAALAAILAALNPLHMVYAGFFTSETPAIALLVGALWLLHRVRRTVGWAVPVAALAGALAAAAVAHRPQLSLNLMLAAVPLLLSWRTKLRPALAVVAAGSVVLAGVVAYNAAATGAVGSITTNGGLNFFLSHCPVYRIDLGHPQREGSFFFQSPAARTRPGGYDVIDPLHDPWDEGHFYRRGWACVREDGLSHVGVLAGNLLDATLRPPPWPPGEVEELRGPAHVFNLASVALLAAGMVGGLVLWYRRRARGERSPEALLLLHVGCLLPLILVYDAETRYRLPYDVIGTVLVATVALGAARGVAGWARGPARRWPERP